MQPLSNYFGYWCVVKLTVEGRLLHHAVPGSTPLYVCQESLPTNSADVMVMTRVEDVALQHYSSVGYPEGQALLLLVYNSKIGFFLRGI